MVEAMAGLGIRQEEIAKLIKSPKSGKGISPHTLREHFREELDCGMVKADAQAMGNLLRLTAKSAGAAIFWAKVRRQWKQPERDLSSKSQEKPQLTAEQIDRRIAQLLAKAEAQEAKGSNVVPIRSRKKAGAA